MEFSILLVDDHKLLREGLKALISQYPGITVIGEATNGKEGVQQALSSEPDVVIMDVSMRELNGIEATRQILAENSDIKVIGLSIFQDRVAFLGMVNAGASGYLLKDCAFDELIFAIKNVALGKYYFCREIAESLLTEYLERADKSELLSVLASLERKEEVSRFTNARSISDLVLCVEGIISQTGLHNHPVLLRHIVTYLERENNDEAEPHLLSYRQREILTLLAENKTPVDIEMILGISQDGVKYHLKKIFRKLEVTSRADAIYKASMDRLLKI